MNLEETVRALDALVGTYVGVMVWGIEGHEGNHLASLHGTLQRAFEPSRLAKLSGTVSGSELRTSVDFEVGGDGRFTIWPHRFVRGERVERTAAELIWVVAQDGMLQVGTPGPWD